MKTLSIFWNNIKFNFNSPVEETWHISEDFDFNKKTAYATLWIQELIKYNNETQIRLVIWEIFKTLKKQTNSQKLDYLQVININWIDTWCIDNWESICLLTKEEY
jgi:hypothetical protein